MAPLLLLEAFEPALADTDADADVLEPELEPALEPVVEPVLDPELEGADDGESDVLLTALLVLAGVVAGTDPVVDPVLKSEPVPHLIPLASVSVGGVLWPVSDAIVKRVVHCVPLPSGLVNS